MLIVSPLGTTERESCVHSFPFGGQLFIVMRRHKPASFD